MAARGIQPPATDQKPREPRTETFVCEFAGLHLLVPPGVYEPNPVSGSLVATLLRESSDVQNPMIVDVGTGSGAIAIAYALRRPDARVFAVDASPVAVACTKANADRLGAGNVQALQGALLEPLAGQHGKVDAIVANIPWVPPAITRVKELYASGRWRGPLDTIEGSDRDGMGLQRALLRQAGPLLAP